MKFELKDYKNELKTKIKKQFLQLMWFNAWNDVLLYVPIITETSRVKVIYYFFIFP